jgi:exosortase
MILTIPWIILAALFVPIFYQLYHIRWVQIDYTHAYFVLPLFLFLIFLKRDALRPYTFYPTPFSTAVGLCLIVIASLMFVLGWREGFLFISTVSFIFFLLGLSLFLMGASATRKILFPILYLFLLVPIPLGILDQVTLPLRYGTSVAVEWCLRYLGYPLHRDGLLLSMDTTEIYVGQPCSGFRSIVTLFSLGLIYIYFLKAKLSHKLILTASIIPFALIGNCIRVMAVCLITFYWGKDAGEGFLHTFSGIVVFLVVILGMFILENGLTEFAKKT